MGGLPWSSDGSAEPMYVQSYGDATAMTLGIPAAWRAMNIIAGFIAQLKLKALDEEQQSAGTYQLLDNPWPVMTYFNWMFGAVCAVVLRGNYYAAKTDYDEATGNPRQLIPIANDDVTVTYDRGQILYDIAGMPRPLLLPEVFHVRGFVLPGMIEGVGVIEAHRTGLRSTRELMDYGAGAYRSGGVPPVVMRVDKPELSEAEAEYLQSRWVARHNVHDRRPAVIPKFVELETVGLSMQDAEYLESRQFSIAEIAYMFNLDPEDLSAAMGSGRGRVEYQNIESKMRDRLIFSLQMWMNRIEQAYYLDLPGNVYARFDTTSLFRANSLDRMRMYEIAIKNKVYTVDEVRKMEGMPSLTEEQKNEFETSNPVPPQLRDFTGLNNEPSTNGDELREEVPA